jgi:hypothetical protein
MDAGLPDAVGKMKQFACWFTHGVGNGSELRKVVHAARTPAEVVQNVERFFERKAASASSSGFTPLLQGGHPAHESSSQRDGIQPQGCPTEIGT